EPRREGEGRRAELRAPLVAQHPAADDLPRRRPEPEPRARGRGPLVTPETAPTIHETQPIVGPGHDFASVTDKISAGVLTQPTPQVWFLGFGVGFILLNLFLFALTNIVIRGVGLYGINIPVGWGFDIINFVWWIGIGHAGTLISAILLLLRQEWRTSINRFAE